MKKIFFWVTVATAFILLAIAALAADDQSLRAAASVVTDDWTLILKFGVPSGLISGLITLLVAYWNNNAAQKNNLDKIKSDTDNLSRELNQRQHEFEIQTKMQIESLHSDEKKKVCWDFLASVTPSLFPNKQFDLEKMRSCVTPLYLYSHDNHFSYFKNLIDFIDIRKLSTFGVRYEDIRKEVKAAEKEYKKCKLALEKREGNISGHDLAHYYQETARLIIQEDIMSDILKSYTDHYELAIKAAKKLIWNEPIEKAQPLQLEGLTNEDDI